MKICPFFYIARTGVKPVLLTLVIFLLAFFFTASWGFWLLVFVLTLYLFINPNKELKNPDEKAVLSPVAGKIISINTAEYENLGKCIEVCINNSLLNPGVLRGFKTCKALKTIHKNGAFLCPYIPSAKRLNERVIYICKKEGLAMRVQAGVFGRTLKLKPISQMTQGEELGFLFDGRVSVLLPLASRLCINVGDKVKALDLLAYLPLQEHE